jgi:hypothetical protein
MNTTTLFIIIKNKKTKNMSTLLAPGQTATGTLTVIDDVTAANVGGWFTNISIVSSAPSKQQQHQTLQAHQVSTLTLQVMQTAQQQLP